MSKITVIKTRKHGKAKKAPAETGNNRLRGINKLAVKTAEKPLRPIH